MAVKMPMIEITMVDAIRVKPFCNWALHGMHKCRPSMTDQTNS
jgi:hypothetical protein